MSESVGSWMGRPCEQMTREELLVVIKHMGRIIGNLRNDLDGYRECVDWDKYFGRRGWHESQ